MIGKTSLAFEHTVLKEAGFKLHESRLVVQALKAYGGARITPKILALIRKKLEPKPRQRILLDTKTSTGWVSRFRRSLKSVPMDKLARLPDRDRQDIFSEVAASLGIRPTIIEKEFVGLSGSQASL